MKYLSNNNNNHNKKKIKSIKLSFQFPLSNAHVTSFLAHIHKPKKALETKVNEIKGRDKKAIQTKADEEELLCYIHNIFHNIFTRITSKSYVESCY